MFKTWWISSLDVVSMYLKQLSTVIVHHVFSFSKKSCSPINLTRSWNVWCKKKAQRNPFIKNLAGTENCFIARNAYTINWSWSVMSNSHIFYSKVKMNNCLLFRGLLLVAQVCKEIWRVREEICLCGTIPVRVLSIPPIIGGNFF